MIKTGKKFKGNGVKVETAKVEPAKPMAIQSSPAAIPQPKAEPIVAATKATSAPPSPLVKPALEKAAPPARPAFEKPSAPPAPVNRVSLELLKPEAKKVCVAGSFNGWKPEKTPLTPAGNGRWVGSLTVDPGTYEYLFVVDGQWLPDPNAKESVQNPFGGRNSIVTVFA